MQPRQLVPYVTALRHAFVKSDPEHTNKLGGCWFDGSRGKHQIETTQQRKEGRKERTNARKNAAMSACMHELDA